MFGSAVLEVAIGLILVYAVLALVVTSVNEYIAQLLSLRAEYLWRAVKGLFQNSPNAAAFAKQIYDHDLIDALSPPTQNAKPSYIPAHLFSIAIVDTLKLSQGDAAVADQVTAAPVDAIIKRTLMPLAVSAGKDLDLFRQHVEAWFNAAMERTSGWYKKRVQVITMLVALGVVLVANADSLMLVNMLWTTPSARQAVSTDASKLSGQTQAPADVKQAQGDIAGLIGWSGPINPRSVQYVTTNPRRFPDGFGEWLLKLIGLAITAFAACLGAPFWFDTLNKVMNIRTAGTAPGEQPKTPTTVPQPSTRIASGGGNDNG